MIKNFKPSYLVRRLNLPLDSIEDKVIYQEIDYDLREIIFMDLDGRYYKTTYIVNDGGVSLCQHGKYVVCKEVRSEILNIIIWKETE